MGSLSMFPIKDWKDKYGLSVMVETGTHRGAGVAHALKQGFGTIHSIELNPNFHASCVEKFSGQPSVTIHLGSSLEKLPEILGKISGIKALWWLDAHLGALLYGSPSDKEPLPLKGELEIIKNSRDASGDVFLIDDLRMYEDGPFRSGNWGQRKKYLGNNPDGIGFIIDLFGSTHEVQKHYQSEGFVTLLPKKG